MPIIRPAAALAGALACCAGCQLGSQPQRAALESQARTMAARVQSLEAENQDLKTAYGEALDRLIVAENELAYREEERLIARGRAGGHARSSPGD